MPGRPWDDPVWQDHHDGPPLEWDHHDRRAQKAYLDALSVDTCTDILSEYIMCLKDRNVLNARQACLLCYWATRAGVGSSTSSESMIKKLAFAPGKASGNYSRHWDVVLGDMDKDDDYMKVQVPLTQRADLSRVCVEVPVVPPHVALHDEISQGGVWESLQQQMSCMPQVYHQHPLRNHHHDGHPPLPLSLYMDGVAFTRTDSVTGFFIYCLPTQTRHLCAVLRKSEMCKCGCRGWCSVHPILMMLRWSLLTMIHGIWPLQRPDDTPWREQDVLESSVAGMSLGFKAIVVFVKADWMEHVTTMGFPGWRSHDHPCPLCTCTLGNWHEYAGMSPAGLPWECNKAGQYMLAVERCEKRVVVTDIILPELRGSLWFDKRAQGNRGRCMKANFPPLGLMKGDRLEPGAGLPTTCCIDKLDPPYEAIFWRVSQETMTHHRNPLMDPAVYLSPENLTVDWLHCFSLGIAQYWANYMLHWMINNNAFGCTGTTKRERHVHGFQHVKSSLFSWYSWERSAGRTRHEVQDLQMGMISLDDATGTTSLKGAEANDFIIFIYKVLIPQCAALENFDIMRRSGKHINTILGLLRIRPQEWHHGLGQDQLKLTASCKTLSHEHIEYRTAPAPH